MGIFISTYEAGLTGKYFFTAGAVLVLVSVCFTIGLYLLKNHKTNGRKWVIAACLGLTSTLALSAFQIVTTSPGWKLTLLTILVSLIAIAPFIWLINYLWHFQNIEKPS